MCRIILANRLLFGTVCRLAYACDEYIGKVAILDQEPPAVVLPF